MSGRVLATADDLVGLRHLMGARPDPRRCAAERARHFASRATGRLRARGRPLEAGRVRCAVRPRSRRTATRRATSRDRSDPEPGEPPPAPEPGAGR